MTEAADLATLTGVRSGKRSYYREFQRSTERLQRTVRAMDSISHAVVRTVEGPRALVEDVIQAAAVHLQAEWLLFALSDGALPDARPRVLLLDDAGQVHDSMRRLPSVLQRELTLLRQGDCSDTYSTSSRIVRVPMSLDGVPVGGLVGWHGLVDPPEPADLSVLRILANQAAVSMHTSVLHQSGRAQQRRAQQLYDETSRQAADLVTRTEELRAAEQRLRVADQRELLDAERHRIALELHDSVAQYVLSAGLAVDVCRSEIAAWPDGAELARRVTEARDFMQQASDQLRGVIYALHHTRGADDVASLPELLQQMVDQHRPHIAATLRVEGRAVALGTAVEHSLARTAGEALFNVAMHARASRVHVRLKYLSDRVTLWISDDGEGDPLALRRQLKLAMLNAADGRHRGLANMAERAREAGGRFAIRRAPLGGIRITVEVPITTGDSA